MPKVRRYFLEIKKNNKIDVPLVFPSNIKISSQNNKDININKFFYRQVGRDHFWRDRLSWSDKEWKKYIFNKNLETGIMKLDDELAGFYEQEFHEDKNEMELIQMGILREHQGKNLGSFLLKYIIQETFSRDIKKLRVHTCSLDHRYALNNYLSKGLKIFKEEEVDFIF